MKRARSRTAGRCGVALVACFLAVACGSRNGLDSCAYGICSDSPSIDSAIGGDGGTAAEPAGAPSVGGAFVGGNGGSAAGAWSAAGAGGSSGAGGSGGTAGVATAAGEAGLGGGAGAGGAAGTAGEAGDAGAGGEAGAGGAATEPPLVLLLVDGSFSMFADSVWTPTYEALTGAGGPIERYQDRVRFGFASYRGRGQVAEDDPSCAEMTSVPFALDNTSAIRDAYGALETRRGYFETPTGHALARATQDLLAAAAEPRKYILLVSDGAPDTCFTARPSCGQDRAVFAVQQAYRAGIETRAIGLGYGREYDCNPDESRCGTNHFQDLANAGRGLRVQDPPEAYGSTPCVAETGGVLLSDYWDRGDAASYSWALSPEEVRSAVDAMLREIVER
jgi:hypothetical protein